MLQATDLCRKGNCANISALMAKIPNMSIFYIQLLVFNIVIDKNTSQEVSSIPPIHIKLRIDVLIRTPRIAKILNIRAIPFA